MRESFIIAADEMRKARSPSPPPRGYPHTLPTPTATAAEEPAGGRHRRSRSDHVRTPYLDEPQDGMSETSPLVPHDHPDSHENGSHRGKSPSGTSDHGHSHGSMNMQAILLHVLGDALGNVGVIATGLVIWQTTWSFKYYFDPVISLVITVIIFSSAMPLGKSPSPPIHVLSSILSPTVPTTALLTAQIPVYLPYSSKHRIHPPPRRSSQHCPRRGS